MHLSEILTSELEAFRARCGKEKLDILETGSIRGEGDNYHANDGWSTLTFATEAKQHGGTVTSIDLDTSVADKVLRAHKLRSQVTLINGHSIDVLAGLLIEASAKDKTPFDVAFLDSDNNSSLIFHEYLIIRKLLRSPALIMIDDVDIDSEGIVKGDEVMPWIASYNIPHRIVTRTGDGYRTGVLVFDV